MKGSCFMRTKVQQLSQYVSVFHLSICLAKLRCNLFSVCIYDCFQLGNLRGNAQVQKASPTFMCFWLGNLLINTLCPGSPEVCDNTLKFVVQGCLRGVVLVEVYTARKETMIGKLVIQTNVDTFFCLICLMEVSFPNEGSQGSPYFLHRTHFTSFWIGFSMEETSMNHHLHHLWGPHGTRHCHPSSSPKQWRIFGSVGCPTGDVDLTR